MKRILFLFIFFIFNCAHAWDVLTNSRRVPNNLIILYETYKKLEHVYALNLFYSGTRGEYLPKTRCDKIILNQLRNWNELIRNELTDKSNLDQKEIELVQTLQIHQKSAKKLTTIISTYNYQEAQFTKKMNEINTKLLFISEQKERQKNQIYEMVFFYGLKKRKEIENEEDKYRKNLSKIINPYNKVAKNNPNADDMSFELFCIFTVEKGIKENYDRFKKPPLSLKKLIK